MKFTKGQYSQCYSECEGPRLTKHTPAVCKCSDFHWTTSGVSMDKFTSGVCLFADMIKINMFVEVELRIDDHA